MSINVSFQSNVTTEKTRGTVCDVKPTFICSWENIKHQLRFIMLTVSKKLYLFQNLNPIKTSDLWQMLQVMNFYTFHPEADLGLLQHPRWSAL